jgi:autotransporter-associated beta strand protein
MFGMIRRNYNIVLSAMLFGFAFPSAALAQGTYIWNVPTDSGSFTWATPSYWAGGNSSSYPGASSSSYDTAAFNSNPTAAVSITAPANLYLNSISFGQIATAYTYTVTGGTINLGGSTTPTISVANNNVSATIASVLAGTQGFTYSGNGTLILTGTNTYSRQTTINSGTLQVGSGGTTGSLGTSTVVDNGSLVYNQTTVTVSNAISGAGAVSSTTFSGGLTFSAGIAMTGPGGFNFTSTGAVNVNTGVNLSVVNGTGVVSTANSGNALTLTGAIGLSATGSGSITVTGSSTASSGGNSGLIFNGASLADSGTVNLNGLNSGSQWGVDISASSSISATSGATTLTGTLSSNSSSHGSFLLINNPTITLTASPGAAIILQGARQPPLQPTCFTIIAAARRSTSAATSLSSPALRAPPTCFGQTVPQALRWAPAPLFC